MKTITAYLSHPIRGYHDCQNTGTGALNVLRAVTVGRILRDNVPGFDLYIPGEHQEFVSKAYHSGRMDDDAILAVDGEILLQKDLVIYFNPEHQFSSGMLYEKDAADRHNRESLGAAIAQYEFCEMTWRVIDDIIGVIARLQP